MQVQNIQIEDQLDRQAAGSIPANTSESLFERCGWFYALCREHLFHDHSDVIARRLWHHSHPSPQTHLLELGCGPGFYACRFAEKFPEIRTTGVDLSQTLLTRARSRAASLSLPNCSFHRADVHHLPASIPPVDSVVVSRLFLVVPNRDEVMREIFRILRPGGRCFIAEPVSSLRTQLPLSCMWMIARLTSFARVPYVDPHRVTTMSEVQFRSLVEICPWEHVEFGRDGRYQYAVCVRPCPDASAQEGTLETAVA